MSDWWLFSRVSSRERELERKLAEQQKLTAILQDKLLLARTEAEDLAILVEKYRYLLKEDAALLLNRQQVIEPLTTEPKR